MSQLWIQDARAVAYRALCLGALLQRGEWELTVQNTDERLLFADVRAHVIQKHEQLNRQLCQWLEDEKILPHFSATERRLLQKSLGTWSERTLVSVGWRSEALGVMLWALQRLDTCPPFDEQFEPGQIFEPLDLMQSTIDFIWLANLRSIDELHFRRDQAELWNWRSRAKELERMGVRPPEGVTFREIIRFTAERALSDGLLHFLIEGDLPAFDKSYATLTEDEYALTSAIAYERYFALNWICELSSEWDNIRIDL